MDVINNRSFQSAEDLLGEGVRAIGRLRPTIVHRLQGFSEASEQLRAFTMILDEDWNEDRLTFRELDTRARAIAAEIQQRAKVGDRVLIVLDPGIHYVASLYGCMYAGAIAVPVYPPSMLRLQHTLSRLQSIIHDADAALMLSSRSIIGDSLSPLWNLDEASAIAVDELDLNAASDWQDHSPSTTDTAILQYTSGSTGTPRGVVLTHANLTHNCEALVRHFHFPGAKAVNWLPPYHDMGLIGGILLPSYEGVETVFMAPKDFMASPIRWLRAFDRYRGSSAGSPNFGYELCVRKITEAQCEGLDLSSWKVAVSGAEPVRASTIKRFTEKFAPYGFDPSAFCPALGMAESTVIVTGSRLGETPVSFEVDSDSLASGTIDLVERAHSKSQTLMSSGETVMDMELEIVDPVSRERCPAGTIGEIWIRGPSIASGYWNQPEKTAETFDASILPGEFDLATFNEEDNRGYLRTGDLGCLIDNELIVTGRRKELIIIGGRNLYPHDVEAAVQSRGEAFKVDGGVAFSIDVDQQEQLIVLQEVLRPKKHDVDALLQEALDAIATTFEVTPHAVLLVKTGSLPKTSSGKLRRSDCRDLFLADDLPILGAWYREGSGEREAAKIETAENERPQTGTEVQLAAIWANLLDLESPISRDDDFFNLGGQSLLVSQLLLRVGQQFGVELETSSLFANSSLGALAKHIDSKKETASSRITLQRAEASPDGRYPLSKAQQRFWLLNELQQTDAFLFVAVGVDLQEISESQPLDSAKVQAAIELVCQRHLALRTRFEVQDGLPWQSISDSVTFELVVDQFTNLPEIRERFGRELLDLSKAPLMRAALLSKGDGNWHLEIVLHHIICDASSIEILLSDLSSALRNDGDQATNAPLRYIDYATWDHQDASNHESLAYWKCRLAEAPEKLRLPAGREASSNANRESREISQNLARRVEALAKSCRTMPATVYLAAYQYVLSRFANSYDLPIGMPTTQRATIELNRTIGCFMNPIIFRGRVDPSQRVVDLIGLTHKRLSADLDHQSTPFQDVVSMMDQARSINQMPLAQNLFLYQQELAKIDSLFGTRVTDVTPDYSHLSAYDLALIVHPGASTRLTLATARNVANTVAADFLTLFERTLCAFVDAPENEVSLLPAAPAQDASELQTAVKSQASAGQIPSVLQRFAEQTAADGKRLAITDDSKSVTFQELSDRSDAIAHALSSLGLERESLIGLCHHRSSDMIAAILGIWKAGCAYVPLDPRLPPARLGTIIEDAELGLILTDRSDRLAEEHHALMRVVDDLVCESQNQHAVSANEFVDASAHDRLAYVIYTSGSTGKPKGVAIEHGSVANLMQSFADDSTREASCDRPRLQSGESILALTTTSFDISVLEMFLPLWAGGCVRLTDVSAATQPEALSAILDQEPIDWLQTTPSTLRILLTSGWQPREGLKVLSGGEPLTVDLASDLLRRNVLLWNVYGPTETTVWSSVSKIEGEATSSDQPISIGQPIDNTSVFVVDEQLRPLPTGVVGELCIGGFGLARGYWRQESLTADRFVKSAIDGISQRLYRTGDLAFLDADGLLQYVARNDRQIKLRGFRIELDEIQSVLSSLQGVAQAAVTTQQTAGQTQIVAFVVLASGGPFNVADAAKKQLPDYMMPSQICEVASIPQTAAGKVDYKSLPHVASGIGDEGTGLSELAGKSNDLDIPQTPLEESIAEIWSEVLEIDRIGRSDNFFRLGGNSLQAAQLFSRLRERLSLKIELRRLYEEPTIAAVAQLVLSARLEQQVSDPASLIEQIEGLSDEEVLRALQAGDSADTQES